MHYYHRHHHEDGDGYGYDGDETKVLIHFHTASLFLFFLLLIQTDDAYKKKANKTTRRDKRGPNDETLFRRWCPRCMFFFSVLSSTNDYLQGHNGFPNVGLRYASQLKTLVPKDYLSYLRKQKD